MEQPIRTTQAIHHLTDSLKTIIDSLKSIFSSSLKGPPQPVAPILTVPGTVHRFGNFTLYSHQRALIEEMKKKEIAFRTGALVGPLKTQLFSRFAILGDPIGTGKTITSLAYIATCKRVPLPPISPQLHPQSSTNFFSTSNSVTTIKTNLFVVPNIDLPIIKDALENQDKLSFKIIKKINHINQELLDDLVNIDLIVVPVTQYAAFSQFMVENNIVFERCFFENIDNIYLTNNNSHLISSFTWLITHNWFNFIFPETNLFDYGTTLDHFLQTNVPNQNEDILHYINMQRLNTQHSTPNSRSIFNNFIVQHPYRHRLITITSGNYLNISLNPGTINHQVLHYNYDERFQVVYQVYSAIVGSLIDKNDIVGALDAVGAQTMPREKVVELCRDQSEEDCPICFSSYNVPTLTPCCKNLMCAECIFKSCTMNSTKKCPFCRQDINGMKLIASEPSINIDSIDELQNQSKINVLVNYLKLNQDKKILLYFPNQARFGKLKKTMKLQDIHYEMINGPRSSNRTKIEKFNNNKTSLLIIHDHEQLTGYYISKVSHIIIYPDYTNANIRQYLMGRTQSFIRAAPLTIVDFVFSGAAAVTT